MRVLEEGRFRRVGGLKDAPYDARIIAASNRDLKIESEAGRLRADLFYRLSVIQIELPPLRERGDDVLVLTAHFIEHFNQRLRKKVRGLAPEVAEIFRHHSWPGNVRELRNVIERAMILEDDTIITTTWLPRGLAGHKAAPAANVIAESGQTVNAPFGNANAAAASEGLNKLFSLPPAGVSLDAVEQSLLMQAIKMTRGNQTKAAELLRISRDQLRYRLKKIEGVPVEDQNKWDRPPS